MSLSYHPQDLNSSQHLNYVTSYACLQKSKKFPSAKAEVLSTNEDGDGASCAKQMVHRGLSATEEWLWAPKGLYSLCATACKHRRLLPLHWGEGAFRAWAHLSPFLVQITKFLLCFPKFSLVILVQTALGRTTLVWVPDPKGSITITQNFHERDMWMPVWYSDL